MKDREFTITQHHLQAALGADKLKRSTLTSCLVAQATGGTVGFRTMTLGKESFDLPKNVEKLIHLFTLACSFKGEKQQNVLKLIRSQLPLTFTATYVERPCLP